MGGLLDEVGDISIYVIFAYPESKARATECAHIQEQDMQTKDNIMIINFSADAGEGE